MTVSPIKQSSALLPLAMSLVALAMVLGHAAIFGIIHQADEAVAAQTLQVLALQAGAALAAITAVVFLTWRFSLRR